MAKHPSIDLAVRALVMQDHFPAQLLQSACGPDCDEREKIRPFGPLPARLHLRPSQIDSPWWEGEASRGTLQSENHTHLAGAFATRYCLERVPKVCRCGEPHEAPPAAPTTRCAGQPSNAPIAVAPRARRMEKRAKSHQATPCRIRHPNRGLQHILPPLHRQRARPGLADPWGHEPETV